MDIHRRPSGLTPEALADSRRLGQLGCRTRHSMSGSPGPVLMPGAAFETSPRSDLFPASLGSDEDLTDFGAMFSGKSRKETLHAKASRSEFHG